MARRTLPALLFLFGACATTPVAVRVRPADWAQPVLGAALGNGYRVDDDLYRCAQPDRDGMRALARLGVRTVVNLRELHSDAGLVTGTGLQLIECPCGAGDFEYAQLVATLRRLLQARKPMAVHCWRGADRTGVVVAAWRIAVDGWTKEAALDEMCGGGFGHAGCYGNLRELVAGLDAGRLRADVGLGE